MRFLTMVAVCSCAVASPAFAQTSSAPTGLRAEGIVGFDRVDVEGESANGVVYGAGLGYDFGVGGAVIGLETELTESTAKECVSDVEIAGDELCAQTDREFYFGARIGAPVGRNTLVYAKGGYLNGRVGISYEDGTPATTGDVEAGADFKGWRLGTGAEFGLSRNSFLKTEYRYSNYEEGFDKHQLVAGFGFRF